MFDPALFADPRFPLAVALIGGGATRTGRSMLPQMLMQAVPQSATLAQSLQRQRAWEELARSGALSGPTGLTEEQAAALARALGRGGEGASALTTLLATAPNRELQREQLRLQIENLREQSAERQRAQQLWNQMLERGVLGPVAGTAGAQPTSGGEVDPRIYLFGASLPGMNEGQRAALRALYEDSRREDRQPYANEFNRIAFAMFGRMPRTQQEFGQVLAYQEKQKLQERAALSAAAASAAAAATAGVQANTPMRGSELTHFIDKYGNTPPPGTTPADLRKSKEYRAVPESIASGAAKVQGTYALLDRLGELSKRLNTKQNFIDRAIAGGEMAWQMFAQSDPDVAEYASLSGGALSNMIRALGEVGALTEGDVQRARALMPKLYPLPDTPQVAAGKLRQVEEILRRATGIEPKPKRASPGEGWNEEKERRYQELLRRQGATQ